MAAALGWGLRRWQAARNVLVRLGIIACLHEGGLGPGDPPIYGWVEVLDVRLGLPIRNKHSPTLREPLEGEDLRVALSAKKFRATDGG